MLNAGFVTRKALAQWQNIPVFLPQFQFHEKHQAVINTACPEKILPLVAKFNLQQDAIIYLMRSRRCSLFCCHLLISPLNKNVFMPRPIINANQTAATHNDQSLAGDVKRLSMNRSTQTTSAVITER